MHLPFTMNLPTRITRFCVAVLAANLGLSSFCNDGHRAFAEQTTATAAATTNSPPTPGLVQEQPASGRYVETEQGFMIPYTATIPGTDVEFTMQPIPGGTFMLGSPDSEADRGNDEGPQVEIKIAPFWMAQHEVTWAEYKSFMNLYHPLQRIQSMRAYWQTENKTALVVKQQKALKESAKGKAHLTKLLSQKVTPVDAITVPTPLHTPLVTYESGEDPRQPAVTMSQYAAKQYTKWLAATTQTAVRLPTEAEWEYACRAGGSTAFHFGDDAEQLEDYGWFTDNSDGATQKVEQKKPNPWGLFDMHGNVMEWVIDGYAESGYDHLDTSKPHSAAEAIRKTDKLFPRVLRGGHWDEDADRCRAAARVGSNDKEWYEEDPNEPKSPWWLTDYPAGSVGFRSVRSLNPLTKDEKKLFYEADVERLIEDIGVRLENKKGVQENASADLPHSIVEAQQVDEMLQSK